MDRPFLLVQLSDSHLGATSSEDDPAAAWAAAIGAVRALADRPDVILITGDIADHGAEDEYAQAHELLEGVGAPVYVLAGNHDERGALRRRFGAPGAGEEPIQYAAELGPLRLLALDSTRPGQHPGELDEARLGWLEDELSRAPQTPTLVALHHPPLKTGVPVWDASALPDADAAAFGEVIARHPQVLRVIAGHLHRTLTAEIAGRSLLVAPSTYLQARLDFGARAFEMVSEAPGFVVHAFGGARLVSYLIGVR